jgi:hypothetical protein
VSAPLSPEVALLRLAQYGERTSTWSTATYNDGSEKALHEIALTLADRVAELEAERHSTNEALDDAVTALREKAQQLAAAEQLRLTPLERLTLRFALELVDDAIANDPTDITDADRAAMDKLRALSTGPVVAYRNPWRPGVLLCVEHGEGWAGMKPLSVEDLPNGGTCTAGDPADPDDVCGRDVLATEAGERA